VGGLRRSCLSRMEKTFFLLKAWREIRMYNRKRDGLEVIYAEISRLFNCLPVPDIIHRCCCPSRVSRVLSSRRVLSRRVLSSRRLHLRRHRCCRPPCPPPPHHPVGPSPDKTSPDSTLTRVDSQLSPNRQLHNIILKPKAKQDSSRRSQSSVFMTPQSTASSPSK
jgi:hypothetical protein